MQDTTGRRSWTRAEKRAYYIGIGAGGSDEGVSRAYVRSQCGGDAAVMASFERGVQVGRAEKLTAASKASSFRVADFYEAAIRRTYRGS